MSGSSTLLTAAVALVLGLAAPAGAQVILDGSLGTTGPVGSDPSDPDITYWITQDLGQQTGANLFHSFSLFDIRTGETASFVDTTNSGSIDNIVARITGGTRSTIDGLIQSQIAGASLFLLNPAGFLFKENARLDLTGSGYFSSAPLLRFPNGIDFDARESTPPPALSAADPIAFGFLGDGRAASIDLRLGGLGLEANPFEETTLGFVAGDISIGAFAGVDQTIRTSGVLALAAVGKVRTDVPVDLSSWDFAAFEPGELGGIRIHENAVIDVTGQGFGRFSSGAFVARGGRFFLGSSVPGDKTAILVCISGSTCDSGSESREFSIDIALAGDGDQHTPDFILEAGARLWAIGRSAELGGIRISAPNIDLRGLPGEEVVGLRTVGLGADIASPAVELVAERITITDGAIVETLAVGPGNGGALFLAADEITIDRGASVRTINAGSGVGGTVLVDAGSLTVDGGLLATDLSSVGDGGSIRISASGAVSVVGSGAIGSGLDLRGQGGSPVGRGGAVVISADTILVGSHNSNVFGPSQIFTVTRAGPGSRITLVARQILLIFGGQVASLGLGAGDAGLITVAGPQSANGLGSAELLKIEGQLEIDGVTTPSGLFARALGSGDGGSIATEARIVEVRAGGQISASASRGSTGNAGAVAILDAERVTVTSEPSSGAFEPAPSEISVRGGDGIKTGAVTIDTEVLQLLAGGGLVANTAGTADAGSIIVDAREVLIDGSFGENLVVTASGIFSQSVTGGTGSAGDIELTVGGSLTVSDGAEISVSAIGQAFAGDITIEGSNADVLLTGGAQVTGIVSSPGVASPGQDPTADVVIATVNSLTMDDGALISVETDGSGQGGVAQIRTRRGVSLAGGARISSRSSFDGDAGDIRIAALDLALDSGAAISAEARGSGDGGLVDIAVRRQARLSNGGRITSSSRGAGDAGNVSIGALDLLMDGGGLPDETASAIIAETTGRGFGGSVDVQARRSVTLMANAKISAESLAMQPDAGAAGRVGVFAPGFVRLRDSSVTAQAAAPGVDGGDIAIGGAPGSGDGPTRTRLLVATDSEIVTSSAGIAGANIALAADVMVFDNSVVDAGGVFAGSGLLGQNLDIDADFVFLSPESELRAGGELNIDAVVLNPDVGNAVSLPQEYLDPSIHLRASCSARASGGAVGSFTVAVRPGLPTSPEGMLLAFDDVGAPSRGTAADDSDLPPVAAGSLGSKTLQVAAASLAQGASALRGGHFDEAAEQLSRASNQYAKAGDATGRSEALRGLGQSQQALGQYAESVESLTSSLELTRAIGDRAAEASVLGSVGNAYLALGEAEAAEEYLRQALALARELEDQALAARLLNHLGNLHASVRRPAEALSAYEESAALANEAGISAAEARAMSGAGRAALETGEISRSRRHLEQARARLASLPSSHENAAIQIHLAQSTVRLAELSPDRAGESLLAAFELLAEAVEIANSLRQPLLLSYALGNLGGLYESENRPEEALYFTRQAIRAAGQAEALESLYRWYWQEGRLLWAQGQATEALHSYRRAVAILQEIRPEARAQYGSAAARFRRAVAPVYVDFVDALLQGSGIVTDPSDAQRLLVEARTITEQLKAAELRDYFRDECVAEIEARQVDIDRLTSRSQAAVVYPIVLPDRTELLVSLPSGIERVTVPVAAGEIRNAIDAYLHSLQIRTTTHYRASAEQLYDWLVRPYADRLAAEQVQTLVFVPDGALRTVPMAALYDGEHFLAERYAVAVTPGLSLVAPQPLDPEKARLLLAGVSEPVQGFRGLPNTAREIETIRALYGGDVLLDDAFQTERFESELASGAPSVVHIASHAVFTGDPATSFVLTHDGRLTMGQLSELVAPTQFRKRPLELLTLSACETAAGDERAALGLAGVAIRAGARSALGSLWAVQDDATLELMVGFYEGLKEPGVSKAEALRRAQAKLITDPRFAHPFYWSPFLLISNWL